MARSKQKPKEEHFEWNPMWIKAGMGVVAAIVIGLAVCYFEDVNRHEQTDRRLSRDPVTSQWYQRAKNDLKAIEAMGGKKSAGQPVALWYGKVDRCVYPEKGEPKLHEVILSGARLMAGTKGKKDTNREKLYIGTRQSSVSPREGDLWLFSVWRDKQGNNHTESACLHRRAGS